MGTGIQPCEALSEKLYIQLALFKIDAVQVCDLKLASCAWLQVFCIFNNLVVVEVKTCDTVVTLRLLGLLLNGNSLAVCDRILRFRSAPDRLHSIRKQ